MQSNQIDSFFYNPIFFRDTKTQPSLDLFPFHNFNHHIFRPRRRVGGRTATSPCFTKKQYWDRCSTCFVPWWRPHLGIHLTFFWKTHTKNPWLLDFWPKCLACKISTKICWSSPPRGWFHRSFRQPERNKNTTQTFQKNPVPNPISGASTSFCREEDLFDL